MARDQLVTGVETRNCGAVVRMVLHVFDAFVPGRPV